MDKLILEVLTIESDSLEAKFDTAQISCEGQAYNLYLVRF